MTTPQAELLAWYAVNARDLPWRRTRDPYRILVSEVMSQQTQVARVIPYYERFLATFPTAESLATAEREVLHRLWKGLGYPSRVERLQQAIRAVLARGAWPDTPEDLRQLPGIGPYTAAAVACFAFGRVVPVVDTNVARVYARRDGLELPLDVRSAWNHAGIQVDSEHPIAYNNGLMELGALVCVARAPRCEVCPWAHRCLARGADTRIAASAAPLKVASPHIVYGDPAPTRGTQRQHIVLALIHHEGRYLVARRSAEAFLGGLWELPGGKREAGEDDRTAVAREVREELGGEVLAARHLLSWHHAYPDRTLTLHAYRTTLFNPQAVRPLAADALRWVSPQELLAIDVPPANQPLWQRLRRYHRLG